MYELHHTQRSTFESFAHVIYPDIIAFFEPKKDNVSMKNG